jgi:thiol:disulfide interchange protein DsbD
MAGEMTRPERPGGPRPRGRRLAAVVLASAVVGLAALSGAAGAAAATAPGPRVRVELVSEVRAVAPGAAFWVGLRQRIAPGWHTYWINPGDSGEPAAVDWTLPAGFEAAPIAWPRPDRIPQGPLMSYGYTEEVVLPVRITAPAALEPGTRVTLAGQASWLVCEKTCIPEEAPVALTLAVGPAASDPAGAAVLGRALRAVPVPSPWSASFEDSAEAVALSVAAAGLDAARIAEVWFYPIRWGVIEHAAAQTAEVTPRGITLRVARGAVPGAVAAPIDGVLVITERLDGGTSSQAFVLSAVRAGTPPAGAGAPALPQALALALAGGLLLNLMPCVLPVLSVKALALARHAETGRAGLAAHGAVYTAGVLASFGVLAGVLLALRAGGDRIGWGFQLQSPWFVALLAYVLFAMALALSGVVTPGGRLQGLGHGLASRGGYAGSFFTGALATVAATPCTAPFMGVALGFAVTQPWGTALLVFEALGLGLALPYLALTVAPAWRRVLPRPGPWMARLKQLLAFPLYASVAWLIWVLSQQAGSAGVAAVLAGLVLVAFAAWLHDMSRDSRVPWRRAATAAAALAVALALGLVPFASLGAPTSGPARADAEGGVTWEPFSARRLTELRAEGRPVFVNLTAAWCITCLVNERVALRSPAVGRALARSGVVPLKGDWTRRDPQITRVLDAFGRSGVPLYLLYPPWRGPASAGEPVVLPQILTEGTVLEAVEAIRTETPRERSQT